MCEYIYPIQRDVNSGVWQANINVVTYPGYVANN
jgi:hypothetical protein